MNNSSVTVSTGSYNAYNADRDDLPRAESPPPLPGMDDGIAPRPGPLPGQAVEMDATTGSPQPPQNGFGGANQFRESDADIAGMVGLQQGITPIAQRHNTVMSDTSRYSTDEYVPPRANWTDAGRNSPRMPSPLQVARRNPDAPSGPGRSPPPPAAGGAGYYEDMDPRFAQPAGPNAGGPLPPSGSRGRRTPPPIQVNDGAAPDYDDIPQGARSPAESEKSNFTSISQRGINPRWNPPASSLMPGYGQQPPPQRRPVPNRNDVLLNNNPDFELPLVPA